MGEIYEKVFKRFESCLMKALLPLPLPVFLLFLFDGTKHINAKYTGQAE
jgi:hypothetical protein